MQPERRPEPFSAWILSCILSLSGHCPENQSDPRGLAGSWHKARHSTAAGRDATDGTPALFKAITE
jgi:hypothetical protein